jgi:hypothetical protein
MENTYKVIVTRNDFDGETLADKVNVSMGYSDTIISLLDNADLLKTYALLYGHINSLKNTTIANDYAKLKKPFQKRLDFISSFFNFNNAWIGFNVSDLGISNFLLKFSRSSVLELAPDADVFKLIAFFPNFNKYLKFDKAAFMKDLESKALSNVNIDILRNIIPNLFVSKTIINDTVIGSSTELSKFNWGTASFLK